MLQETKITNVAREAGQKKHTYATRYGAAYTGERARAHLTRLDRDGTLRVWDSIGQIYTTCHILPADAPVCLAPVCLAPII